MSVRSLTVISISAAFAIAATDISAQQINEKKQSKPFAKHTYAARGAATNPTARVFVENPVPVTTVSAASYEGVAVAPGSIAAAFGDGMTLRAMNADDADPSQPGIQLPTTLFNTTVRVNGRLAGLLSIGPSQINFVVPPETEGGTAQVEITGEQGVVSRGTVQVTNVVPAIFTANADGIGVPAATLIRVSPEGKQTFETITEPDPTLPELRKTKSIDLGPDGEKVFLSLFVSGVRLASKNSVKVLVGGFELTPTFVGSQPDFAGLDQINVPIPRELIGAGIVQLSISVDEFSTSNATEIEIGFRPGTAPPQLQTITDGQMGLAGSPMIIKGSGFFPTPGDNQVMINGLKADSMELANGGLKIMVPYAVQSGKVSVRTPLGEGVSPNDLRIRTSISGVIQNTEGKPIPGVNIKLEDSTLDIHTKTNTDGSFVLADVPPGSRFISIDPSGVPVNPPYPKDLRKPKVMADRDNNLFPISLQQTTGPGAVVGNGGGSSLTYGGKSLKRESAVIINGNGDAAIGAVAAPVVLEIENFKLEVQDQTKVKFPDGATTGMITLTPVKNSKAPVNLPLDYFSSAIVQITPFDVELTPGAKLTFPNTDNFPAGADAILFRYDSEAGVFVKEDAKAAVTADGRFIETEQGAIKKTSLYFAAVKQLTTTITGKVVEASDGKPITKATVTFKGQNAQTDATGAFVLRYVPVKTGELVTVEASVLRASGRVDRTKSSPAVAALIGKITSLRLPIKMPVIENRPPTILVQDKIEVEEGSVATVPLSVSDPDKGQTATAALETAPSFVTLVGAPVAGGGTSYSLRIQPDFGQLGNYAVVIKATDSLGDTAEVEILLTVKPMNRPPSANNISLIMDEDGELKISLDATDPDGDKNLRYVLVGKPVNGTLIGEFPTLVYKPNANFFGGDQFSFKVNDGKLDGNTAVVAITIRPVNDAPILSVPGPISVKVGEPVTFAVSAADVDGSLGMAISSSTLPPGATFTLTSDGTAGQFLWTPTVAGEYRITFNVSDSGTPALEDTESVLITVAPLAVGPSSTVSKTSSLQRSTR